jgi:hypothetical protein
MLWVKTLHILFVTSWFAGLFYLPRIYVNLAQAQEPAVTDWLLGMARPSSHWPSACGCSWATAWAADKAGCMPS